MYPTPLAYQQGFSEIKLRMKFMILATDASNLSLSLNALFKKCFPCGMTSPVLDV
jgi:hypothetical protein